jgi:chemotaxis protein histidine kinase CheA
MTIRLRIILLVLLAFAALAFVGGFAVFRASDSASNVKEVTQGVVPSAIQSVALMTRLKDVHIAALEMVAAPDAATATQLRDTVTQRKAELQKGLDDQLAQATNQAQRGLVKEAQESLQNYFQSIDDTARFKLAGQNEMAAASMGATVDQYLREQGEIMQTLQVEKTRAKDEAISTLNSRLDGTRTTLEIATVCAVIGLCAVGLVLYRQIVLPIGEMEGKMTAIATTQDFTHRVPVERMDEIGRSMTAFNAMIGKIQESTELVAQKTADIHAMLHAIPQGILSLEAGGRIHPEYSEHLKTILETEDIAGADVMAVVFEGSDLGSDARSQTDAAIGATIGEDEMNFEFNAHLLPREITRTLPDGRAQVLDINWSPMCDAGGTVTRLLLCLRDVTELRALARAAEQQRRELALIGEVLAVPQEKFQAFMDDAVGFVEGNAASIRQGEAGASVDLLFRNMHTIKGNARTHGLLGLADVAHRVEQTYDDLRRGDSAWDVERLEREIGEVRQALAEYARISDDKLGRRGPGRRGNVDRYVMVPREQLERVLLQLDAAHDEPGQAASTLARTRAALQGLGTESVDAILASVTDSLAPLAAELGKQAPVCTITDGGIALRSQVAGTLRNAFMHLYRNALDHGIETAADRLAAGKPAAGRIALDVTLDPQSVRLVLRDDGRGLALQRILQKGIERGLVDAGDALTPHQVADLVFRPGFSTADVVTDVSGRGVGMDAVKTFIEQDGGRIGIELLNPDAGLPYATFRTVIELPAKFAVGPVATELVEAQDA